MTDHNSGDSSGENSEKISETSGGLAESEGAGGGVYDTHEELKHWPYSVGTIDATLDPGLIEARGHQLLFQAINQKSLVAFVGSGVPMAYGRVGWGELDTIQKRRVNRLSKDFMACANAALNYVVELQGALKDEGTDSWNNEAKARFKRLEVGGHLIRHHLRHIERLQKTLKAVSKENKSIGEGAPVRFQAMEQLYEALREAVALFPTDDKINARTPSSILLPDLSSLTENVVPRTARREEFLAARDTLAETLAFDPIDFPFTEVTKRMTLDERAHAELIVRNSVLYLPEYGREHWQQVKARDNRETRENEFFELFRTAKEPLISTAADANEVRTKPEAFDILGFFHTNSFKALIKGIRATRNFPGTRWESILDLVEGELDRNLKPAGKPQIERRFVSPTHRFVFEMLFALHPDPLKWIKDGWRASPSGSPIWAPIDPAAYEGRRSLIDADLDPIEKLHGSLGIERFLTTNYDLEIERLFLDQGFRPARKMADEFENHRFDTIGRPFVDLTFDRKHSAKLTEFMVGSPPQRGGVYHLHGNATAESDIVLTERSYMQLYLQNDRHRDTTNEAIRLAFSSKPLLFVGLGMSEGDLLRPLRQFMSDRDALSERTAIVLLPATDPEDSQAQLATSLYLRYGVQTTFYGRATLTLEDNGEVTPVSVEWLHLMNLFIKELKSAFDDARKYLIARSKEFGPDQTGKSPELAKAPDEAKLLEKLREKLGKIAVDPKNPAREVDALSVLFGSLSNDPEINADTRIRELAAPRFVYARHSLYSEPDIAGQPEALGVERALISRLFALSLNFSTSHSGAFKRKNAGVGKVRSALRELRAIEIGLNGCYGSILTGAMCATLDLIRQEAKIWLENWRLAPPRRTALLELRNPNQDGQTELPVIYSRHRVVTTGGETEGCSAVRGDKQHDPAFSVFLDAAEAAAISRRPRRLTPGRRSYIVTVPKGGGRGSFFSAFDNKDGIGDFIEKSWSGHEVPHYGTAIFINFSYSKEVASAWDQLANAIGDELIALREMVSVSKEKPGPDPRMAFALLRDPIDTETAENWADKFLNRKSFQQKCRKYHVEKLRHLPRVAALRTLLQEWCQLATKAASDQKPYRRRILICLSGTDLLQAPDGAAKTREIRDILTLLYSAEVSDTPFDLVTISAEERLPTRFIDNPIYTLIDRCDIPDSGLNNVANRVRLLNLPKETLADIGDIPDTTKAHFLHMVKPFRPDVVLTDEFPALAVLLFSKALMAWSESHAGICDPKTLSDLSGFFSNSRRSGRTFAPLPQNLRRRQDTSLGRFVDHILEDDSQFLQLEVLAYKAAHKQIHSSRDWLKQQHLRKLLQLRYLTTDNRDAGLADGEEWVEIRNALGGSRYLLTIIMAAADVVAQATLARINGGRDPVIGLTAAADAAEDFIRRMRNQIRVSGDNSREDVVLETVLDTYQSLSKRADAAWDIDLHRRILRHVGAVGGPCSADVLVRMPDIRAYFDETPIKTGSRVEHLVAALNALVERKLIFRIASQPGLLARYVRSDIAAEIKKMEPCTVDNLERRAVSFDPAMQFRYALHRTLHGYFMKKLGAGMKRPAESHSFFPTLYSSMESDLPRPTYEAYRFLRRLVAGLSQAPDIGPEHRPGENWHLGTSDHPTQVQALRAALAIARSSFSISLVSRFEDYTRLPAEDGPPEGFFESYRQQIRWIIRKAWELSAKQAPNERNQDRSKDRANLQALYIDDIAWLCNECGIASLVQGSAIEAADMFRYALEVNRKIEGDGPGGARHNSMSLNLAITQITRGELKAAKDRLSSIQRHTFENDDKESPTHYCACTYLALIEHIQGNPPHAETLLDKAYELASENHSDLRAMSIITRLKADIKRRSRDYDAAKLLVRESIAFAEAGGHIDLRNWAVLSRLKLELSNTEGTVANHRFVTQSGSQITDLVRYAKTMNMPALTASAYRMRADILSRQGESTRSGDLAIRSIELSSRHGMTLRKLAAITTYARILRLRGLEDQALSMFRSNLNAAKYYGNQIEVHRIENSLANTAG